MKLIYIDSQEKAMRALPQLKQEALAFDLEFDNNLHHYGLHLCLVQISNGKEVFIFDPLKMDVKLLFPYFEDPNIEKIGFALGEDLRILHYLGCKPKNVFDIAHAYALLDYNPSSLSTILDITLGIETSKSNQTSDWLHRPLKQQQLKYAKEDVLYLFELKDFMMEKLQEKGIEEWLFQENAALDTLDYKFEENYNIVNKKEKKNFSEFDWYLYQKLWKLREEYAQKLDKPPYQVIENKLLNIIVLNRDILKKWTSTKGIHRKIKNVQFAEELSLLFFKWEKEAHRMNLSKIESAKKKEPKEKYQKIRLLKKEKEQIKLEVFHPIQKKIAKDYGENTARFILSNRQLDETIYGKILLPYKKELFIKYGKDLGFEVDRYLS